MNIIFLFKMASFTWFTLFFLSFFLFFVESRNYALSFYVIDSTGTDSIFYIRLFGTNNQWTQVFTLVNTQEQLFLTENTWYDITVNLTALTFIQDTCS